MLGNVESKLKVKIQQQEQQIRSTTRSPLVTAIIGPNAREVWKSWSIVKRRELVRTLVSVVISPIPKGEPGLHVEVLWDRGYIF